MHVMDCVFRSVKIRRLNSSVHQWNGERTLFSNRILLTISPLNWIDFVLHEISYLCEPKH